MCGLPVPDLLDVLRWLEPADHPVIEMGTDAEVGHVPPAPASCTAIAARGAGQLMSGAGSLRRHAFM